MTTNAQPAQFLIPDLQTGFDYLAGISLVNPLSAERELMKFLDALLAAPPERETLLALLERARVPLCFVEEELARVYQNKALVLAEKEEVTFQMVVGAWRKTGQAYKLCANFDQSGMPGIQDAGLYALVLHRCIYYTGMVILEHYRARRELPVGIWLELHASYEMAEALGVAYVPVEDALENNFQATHCAAAYSTLLLIDLASPYSNSVRNLNLVRRWAGMWTPLISIQKIDDDLDVPPYVVEFRSDAPMHPTGGADDPGPDARRLDTSRLGLQIQHMLSQLRMRIPPSQLGLGEENTGHVIQLLEHLIRPWTQAASPRRFRRFAAEGVARMAVGFEAMHFCVLGKEFQQPANSATYTRSEFDQLFTFRDRVDSAKSLNIAPKISLPAEHWTVINHSANGFRLACSEPTAKLMHGQLLAVCPHDGERFLLVHASWLMQEDAGGLVVGVATLPGMPVAVGIRRASNSGALGEKFIRGFLLPAVPAIKADPSVVLPSGMYQASRALDVLSEGAVSQIQMSHILQRGTDFDRISYLPL